MLRLEIATHYFQLIATGVAGDHMGHVQRHVARVPRNVIGQEMDLIMVDVPAQDLQAQQPHAPQAGDLSAVSIA